MSVEQLISIPLRRNDGTIRAHVIIDACDDHFAAHTWCLSGAGYAMRTLPKSKGRRKLYLHREILGLTPGDGLQVDHIDRDPLNCRRSNLRVATAGQNAQNQASRPDSASLYRGVHWDKQRGKWYAKAELNDVQHWLGRYDDELEAAAVAQAWRTAHMSFTIEQA